MQRSVPRHEIELDGSIEDFKLSKASTSLDLAGVTKQKNTVNAKTKNNNVIEEEAINQIERVTLFLKLIKEESEMIDTVRNRVSIKKRFA